MESLNEKINPANVVPYEILPESGMWHEYYVIPVNGTLYRLNISRSNSKGLWLVYLGILSPSGKAITKFKYHAVDYIKLMSTVGSILEKWWMKHKSQYGVISIAFRLPSEIPTKRLETINKILMKFDKLQLTRLDVTGVEDAKNKYIFYSRQGVDPFLVAGSVMTKQFEDYDFTGTFPAEILDSIKFKAILQKSHNLDNISLISSGWGGDKEIHLSVIKKISQGELKYITKGKEEVKQFSEEEIAAAKAEALKKNEELDRLLKELEYPVAFQALTNDSKMDFFNQLIKILGHDWPVFSKSIVVGRSVQYSAFSESVFLPYKDDIERLFEYTFDKVDDDFKKKVFSIHKFAMNIDPLFIESAEYILNPSTDLPGFTGRDGRYYKMFSYFIMNRAMNDKIFQGYDYGNEENKKNQVAFFNKLLNFYVAGMNPKFVMNKTNIRIFKSVIGDRKKFIQFNLSLVKDEVEIPNSTLISKVSEEPYRSLYQKEMMSTLANEDFIVQEELPLDGLNIPEPKHNIFSDEDLKKNKAFLQSLQAKKSKNPSVMPDVYAYTGSNYTKLNKFFRNFEQVEDTNSMISMLKFLNQYFMNAVTLPNSITVSRKTNYPTNVDLTSTFVDAAPLSTSLDSSVWSGKTQMRIIVPKGAKVCCLLGNFSNFSNESEILLPPGSIIKPYRKVIGGQTSLQLNDCIYMGNIAAYIRKTLLEKLEANGIDIEEIKNITTDEFATSSGFDAKLKKFDKQKYMLEVLGKAHEKKTALEKIIASSKQMQGQKFNKELYIQQVIAKSNNKIVKKELKGEEDGEGEDS